MPRLIKFQDRSVHLRPTIRLAGDWLVKAGFTPGQHVAVEVRGHAPSGL